MIGPAPDRPPLYAEGALLGQWYLGPKMAIENKPMTGKPKELFRMFARAGVDSIYSDSIQLVWSPFITVQHNSQSMNP